MGKDSVKKSEVAQNFLFFCFRFGLVLKALHQNIE